MTQRLDIQNGFRFGMLTVVGEAATRKAGRYLIVQCNCGTVKEARLSSLRRGKIKSCTCTRGKNQPLGSASPSWRGGRRMDEGYCLVYVPKHPNSKSNGYVREHTLVMSEHLGRPLVRPEEVHHKNGDKADNRLSNLELWSHSQPPGQRVADKIAWAKEILETYGSDEERWK